MLFGEGNFSAALALCERAIHAMKWTGNPHSARDWSPAAIWVLHGDILSAAGRVRDARRAYLIAVALDDAMRFPIPSFRLGLATQTLGRYGEALECFERAIWIAQRRATNDVSPHNAPLWEAKARLLTDDLGRLTNDKVTYKEALRTIKRALKLNKYSVRGWTIKGRALQALGRNKEAEVAFCQALSIPLLGPRKAVDRDGPVHYNWRAYAYLGLKNYEQALDAVDIAIKEAPNEPVPHLQSYFDTKGEIYMAMEKFDEALIEFDHALAPDLVPNYLPSLRKKAITLYKLHRDTEAMNVEAQIMALTV
jgi:tetratricopeptide (TPR) repeat protein